MNYNSYKSHWTEQNYTCAFMNPTEQNHICTVMTQNELVSALKLVPMRLINKMESFLYEDVGH